MSNTVITNYTDLNGPSTKADSSVVVIVNKDGSLSVDEKLLGTLIGTDGSQGAISVVRVGHEGRPDDATDSETETDNKVPHVTLSVDSYFEEPNSILKYDSGAEMLQSFRIETRENSLLGFQNDHCYTPLTSPEQSSRDRSDYGYDDPIIEIRQEPPPKPVPSSKKITILEQKIIPKGRKLPVPSSGTLILKGHDALSKQLPLGKGKIRRGENTESSSITSDDSAPDRDSDSDYHGIRDGARGGSFKKTKTKPKILKSSKPSKVSKPDLKSYGRTKAELMKQINKQGKLQEDFNISGNASMELKKGTPKQGVRSVTKKPKKTPVTALMSEMTSLFSSPDVIRRVSTDIKGSAIKDKVIDKTKSGQKSNKQRASDRPKGYDLMPQIDDASLAQILQDTTPVSSKNQTTNSMNSPSLAGPLSPTLDLLGGLQPEEEGLTEDLLMHVAQLVESSENLQEVIDKQVLGKVDASKPLATSQLAPGDNMYTPSKSAKVLAPRKDPIEIVRRDGRVITLPPIEAPATRASKRRTQGDPIGHAPEALASPELAHQEHQTIDHSLDLEMDLPITKHYINKKAPLKRPEDIISELETVHPVGGKSQAESQESWNSEDDPNRLWCICRQPHNNRFMICCDGCEDWFHGKCVNITKGMGQQMEEQGIEWRCPKCTKQSKPSKRTPKPLLIPKTAESEAMQPLTPTTSKQTPDPRALKLKSSCIVCRKPARASSIYCSDACIQKHAHDSLGSPQSPQKPGSEGVRPEKIRADSRVIVFERKTGRCLAGSNAPTAENLKEWLQKHPTFEVVRPGALSAIKPGLNKKPNEPKKIQTTLNFERMPKKLAGQSVLKQQVVSSQGVPKSPLGGGREPQQSRPPPQSAHVARLVAAAPPQLDVARPSTSSARPTTSQADVKKQAARATTSRSQSAKASPSPATPRRKDSSSDSKQSKMSSVEPIRDNVRKALEEQMTIRMRETSKNKFTGDEIKQFAIETEAELHDLFKDVGVKYKAKYRSLMFNIKDRKNLTLWHKICDKSISPKQLVRLSPEELASQELAEWRDQEAKHQLELIKKSELDLLAASKTYVLKTHKGEEVMQNKTSVSTELDPNVPVEDLVTALNDSTAGDESTLTEESLRETEKSPERRSSKRKHKDHEESSSRKSTRDSKREPERKQSRPSKGASESNKREDRPSRRSDRSGRSSKARSPSKDRSKKDSFKEKSEDRPRSSRRNTRSSTHSRSKSQERERSPTRRRSRSRDAKKRPRSKSRDRGKAVDKSKTRSKSQDNKKKRSSDNDAIDRPKSALQKEAHPEYDPHEPMITSAISEEDLRKFGDDDSLKVDIGDYAVEEYDPTKPFTIDSPVLPKYSARKDKASEGESDQEPSSTVDNAGAIIWNGCINMVDVARFYVAAHDISGNAVDLEDELSTELDIVGRINPETVWEYIGKMRRAGNKDIILLRLEAANDEEKMQYIALYSYLSSRKRLGVVKVPSTSSLKDLYIVPVSASAPLPPVLAPLETSPPGDSRSHLLIAVVIRQLNKWRAPPPAAAATMHVSKDLPPVKITRSSRKRSSTPPAPAEVNAIISSFSSPTVSTTIKGRTRSTRASAAAAAASREGAEPYSPGSPTTSVERPPDVLRTKMQELNRQIEEQKQQIRKLTHTEPSAADEDEAYSPSRPMTPPAALDAEAAAAAALADIALPSNLHEILANIKQRSDVDMRNLP